MFASTRTTSNTKAVPQKVELLADAGKRILTQVDRIETAYAKLVAASKKPDVANTSIASYEVICTVREALQLLDLREWATYTQRNPAEAYTSIANTLVTIRARGQTLINIGGTYNNNAHYGLARAVFGSVTQHLNAILADMKIIDSQYAPSH